MREVTYGSTFYLLFGTDARYHLCVFPQELASENLHNPPAYVRESWGLHKVTSILNTRKSAGGGGDDDDDDNDQNCEYSE